jgi:hypothetical protein
LAKGKEEKEEEEEEEGGEVVVVVTVLAAVPPLLGASAVLAVAVLAALAALGDISCCGALLLGEYTKVCFLSLFVPPFRPTPRSDDLSAAPSSSRSAWFFAYCALFARCFIRSSRDLAKWVETMDGRVEMSLDAVC